MVIKYFSSAFQSNINLIKWPSSQRIDEMEQSQSIQNDFDVMDDSILNFT